MFPNLIYEMKLRKITPQELAKKLSVGTATIYRRLQGEIDWKLSEIVCICEFLNMYDIQYLFLRLDTKTE